MINFEEYKELGEPEKAEKSEIWQTAIGLQEVDGLKPSEYLLDAARQNIEGDITIFEVKEKLQKYYNEKPTLKSDEERVEEADKVSAHIVEILSEKAFVFSPAEYLSIHARLFDGIYEHAGKIRGFNIAKNEWVLNNKTVTYASATNIMATLDYDFLQEKGFNYKGLSKRQMMEHVAQFISNIWQIHAFEEGNTRATAVFAIKYLRTLGFAVNNDLFEKHSWFFRNALVRANYTNYDLGVYSTLKYLYNFFGNLLLGESNVLKNREMHILNEINNNELDTQNEIVKNKNDTVKVKSNTVKDVLDLILEDKTITAKKISELLGFSLATAKRRLQQLKDDGIIIRVGSDKSGCWEVVKKD